MKPEGIRYFDERGSEIDPEITHIDWDIDVAEKGGYPDFMLKEIHEQPRVVRDTLAGRLVGQEIVIDELTLRAKNSIILIVYILLVAELATMLASLLKTLLRPGRVFLPR